MEKVEGIRHWYMFTNPNEVTPMIVSETEYAVEWRKTMEQKLNEIVDWINEQKKE